MTYTKGDPIDVDYDGRTVEAIVVMASPNGQSLMIRFEAMLGGHVGMMPVTMIDDFNGYSIMDGTHVTIRKKATLQ